MDANRFMSAQQFLGYFTIEQLEAAGGSKPSTQRNVGTENGGLEEQAEDQENGNWPGKGEPLSREKTPDDSEHRKEKIVVTKKECCAR
jgi:hypothetical protein